MVEAEVEAVAPVVGMVRDAALEQRVRLAHARLAVGEPDRGEAVGMVHPGIERGDHVDQRADRVGCAPTGPCGCRRSGRPQPVEVGDAAPRSRAPRSRASAGSRHEALVSAACERRDPAAPCAAQPIARREARARAELDARMPAGPPGPPLEDARIRSRRRRARCTGGCRRAASRIGSAVERVDRGPDRRPKTRTEQLDARAVGVEVGDHRDRAVAVGVAVGARGEAAVARAGAAALAERVRVVDVEDASPRRRSRAAPNAAAEAASQACFRPGGPSGTGHGTAG